MPAPPPATTAMPPHPREDDTVIALHDDERRDPYAWMRERESAEVAEHLRAEAEYVAAETAHLDHLRDELFADMRELIPATEETSRTRHGEWLYFQRTRDEWEYVQVWRARLDGSEEQLLLDCNERARDVAYFALGDVVPSPDGSLIAWSSDTEGSERYSIRVFDPNTGAEHPDVIDNVASWIAWRPDGSGLFYAGLDDIWRINTVHLHTLNTKREDDIELFREDDPAIWVGPELSRSQDWLIINAGSRLSTGIYVVDAHDPTRPMRTLLERRHDVRAIADHQPGRFLLLINDDGRINYRLVSVPEDDLSPDGWSELVAHDEAVSMEQLVALEHAIAIGERADGQYRIHILDENGERTWRPPHAAYSLSFGENPQFDAPVVRVIDDNPATPITVRDIDCATAEHTVVHQRRVGGGFDPARYNVRREHAVAADGTKIPLTILELADHSGQPRPTLIQGYGSYGIPYDQHFRSWALPLVDRGLVIATAHIRGGGEFGESWWEQGRMQAKTTTFTDFIAATQYLIDSGTSDAARIAALGGSAGGMLMGAICNMRPDLYRAVLAQVPFVDVLNTILDPTLPLSVFEYEEWGNPNIAGEYAWMRAYSPYDNIRRQKYPAVLATGGLHDPRVSYWEPLKWVARLRAQTSGGGPFLVRINDGAGHFGSSGRLSLIAEHAANYAWVLDQLGCVDALDA